MVLSILIRSSKTDQEKSGVTRTLRTIGSELLPVKAMKAFFDMSSPVVGDSHLPPNPFRAKLVETTKWAANMNHIPSAVANAHSLRAVGATAMFAANVDWIIIQRWGRWKSLAFHAYIWHDFSGFLDLVAEVASARGLNKFLVDVAPHHKRVRFDSPSAHTTGSALSVLDYRLFQPGAHRSSLVCHTALIVSRDEHDSLSLHSGFLRQFYLFWTTRT